MPRSWCGRVGRAKISFMRTRLSAGLGIALAFELWRGMGTSGWRCLWATGRCGSIRMFIDCEGDVAGWGSNGYEGPPDVR